jgi:hypothetical protein
MRVAAIALALLVAANLAAAPSDEIDFTANSVNVAEPGTRVKIKILRWSTEDETRPIVTALAAPPAQPSEVARANAAAGSPPGAARGRGAAAGGRGAAAAGRGRGRGGPAVAPLSPIAAFTAALARAPTVGYIWTSDITGYSIKYAWHAPLPDGTDRIILASDRRLGAYTNAWKPLAAEASAKGAAAQTPETDYAFTLIELRVGQKGLIEGKTSLTNKVVVDADAKTVTIENYSAASTSLEPVKTTKPRS